MADKNGNRGKIHLSGIRNYDSIEKFADGKKDEAAFSLVFAVMSR